MTEHQGVTAAGLDKSLNTFENAVDTKLVAAADLIEERADEMLAKASKLSKRVGGGAKGLFGRAKAAAADKMATLEQEWQQLAAEEQERHAERDLERQRDTERGAGRATTSNIAGGISEMSRPEWPRYYVRFPIRLLPLKALWFDRTIFPVLGSTGLSLSLSLSLAVPGGCGACSSTQQLAT